MHRLCSFFFLLSSLFLLSCTRTPQPALTTSIFIYRFAPPALVEFSKDFQPIHEIPFSIPPNCGLFNIFPAPIGQFMAIELSCPNGQTVLLLDADTAAVGQPVTGSDSHFLAWAPDGKAAYLKVDSLGNTQILRVSTAGRGAAISIPAFTYDLATAPEGNELTYTFSAGLGQGSELWFSDPGGRNARQLYSDPFHYVSFARFAPDGTQIAFLKTPDTRTPFTVGELWVMNHDGSNARKLADADAGHGYAANWSPDGQQLAFVVRENPDEERADQMSEALVSNIYIVDGVSGELIQVTDLERGRVETPLWSPDGNTVAFNTVIDDRMTVQIADMTTGEIRSLMTESSCCPAWMRK